MLREDKDVEREIVHQMKGGLGDVEIKRFLKPEEFHGKGRLFGKITLKPGSSIGLHQHMGDCETFYILSGNGTYNDNGTMVSIKPGQVLYVDNGESHSIENTGGKNLELIAMILFV